MKQLIRLVLMACMAVAGMFATASVYTVNYVRHTGRDSLSPKRLQSVGSSSALSRPTQATLRTYRVAAGENPQIPAELSVGDILCLELFADVSYTVTLVSRLPGKSASRKTFLASTDGSDGPRNVVVVWTAAGLQIDVRDYDRHRGYSVFTTAGGVVVREVDAKKVKGRHLPSPEIPAEEEGSAATASLGVKKLAAMRDVFVDVLVAYDTGAASWAIDNGGGLENFAEMAVQRMNKALDNSGISSSLFSFRLVGTCEVGASAGGDLEGALYAAQEGKRSWNGGDWSGIRLKREKVGADVVVTLIDGSSIVPGPDGRVTSGIGFSLTANNTAFAGRAYSCCAIEYVADDHTMTHEVGHNMGAGHSDTQADSPGPQYHSYSSGYYLTVNGTACHTIMAYDTDGRTDTEYQEIDYFSTPDESYYGVPVGDATHNNALTLCHTYQMVSRFKTAKDEEGAEDPSSEDAVPMGEFFGLQWTTGSEHPWTFGLMANGVSAARSGDFRNDTNAPSTGVSWLETSLTGPCVISFSYDTYFNSGPFLVSIDGTAVKSIPGGEQWDSIEVPAGVHTVRFAFECYDWYCSSTTFNGVWIYDLRVCARELFPVVVPASASDPETAKRFTGELTVQITNSVPDSTIYYSTNHFGDGMSDAKVYTGPLRLTRSSAVRAFARARDGTTSGLSEHVFIERHDVQPGEWTADAEGVLAAAKTSGNLILTVATFSEKGQTAAFGDLVGVAESASFCQWARDNKVYLLACDMTRSQGGLVMGDYSRISIGWGRYIEYRLAHRYFSLLASETDLSTSRLVVSRAWEPSKCVGEMAGKSGSYLGGVRYRGTVASLIECLKGVISPRPTKTVTVTLDVGEGTVSSKTLTRQAGQPFGILPVPTWKNYIFKGWKVKAPLYDEDDYWFNYYFGGTAVVSEDAVPYQDVTLVAQWEYAGVYVYFMRQYAPNGLYYGVAGDVYQRGLAYGSLPLQTPAMTGYTFLGWYDSKVQGVRITEDSVVPNQTTTITNYAQWSVNTYNVRFNANGTSDYPTSGAMANQAFVYDRAQSLKKATFAREGYEFAGWAINPDLHAINYVDGATVSNLTSNANGTVDLYAVWNARKVKITFDNNGFPNFENIERNLAVGSQFSIQIPTYTSTRYVVEGFYTAPTGGTALLGTTLVPARDTTYYLHWRKKPYTVTFNANGGSGAMTPQSFVYGESQRLKENAFAKSGCLFAGWATSSSGDVSYVDRQRVNNLVATEGGTFPLYAKWERTVQPESSLVSNGGPYRQTVGKYSWTFYVSGGNAYVYSIDEKGYYQSALSPTPTGSVEVPSVLGGRSVVCLAPCAFWCCRYVERIVIPAGVVTIATSAFRGCSQLKDVVFMGNAPTLTDDQSLFPESNDVVVWFSAKSSGWQVAIPGKWKGYTITRVDAGYRLIFDAGGGTGTMSGPIYARDKVCVMPACTFENAGSRFAGWACSNGRRYDAGVPFFNLAEKGETVKMTAIWE